MARGDARSPRWLLRRLQTPTGQCDDHSPPASSGEERPAPPAGCLSVKKGFAAPATSEAEVNLELEPLVTGWAVALCPGWTQVVGRGMVSVETHPWAARHLMGHSSPARSPLVSGDHGHQVRAGPAIVPLAPTPGQALGSTAGAHAEPAPRTDRQSVLSAAWQDSAEKGPPRAG